MFVTTPRLRLAELNVAAAIFASERDLMRAAYRGLSWMLSGQGRRQSLLMSRGDFDPRGVEEDLGKEEDSHHPCVKPSERDPR